MGALRRLSERIHQKSRIIELFEPATPKISQNVSTYSIKTLHSPHPFKKNKSSGQEEPFLTHKHPDFPLPDDALWLASGYMLDQDI
jgi:hypothetical protein